MLSKNLRLVLAVFLLAIAGCTQGLTNSADKSGVVLLHPTKELMIALTTPKANVERVNHTPVLLDQIDANGYELLFFLFDQINFGKHRGLHRIHLRASLLRNPNPIDSPLASSADVWNAFYEPLGGTSNPRFANHRELKINGRDWLNVQLAPTIQIMGDEEIRNGPGEKFLTPISEDIVFSIVLVTWHAESENSRLYQRWRQTFLEIVESVKIQNELEMAQHNKSLNTDASNAGAS